MLTTYQSTTKYLVNRVTDTQVCKLMEKNAGKWIIYKTAKHNKRWSFPWKEKNNISIYIMIYSDKYTRYSRGKWDTSTTYYIHVAISITDLVNTVSSSGPFSQVGLQKPWYKIIDDKEWWITGPYVVILCKSHGQQWSTKIHRCRQPIWIKKMFDQIEIPTLQINSKVSQINSKVSATVIIKKLV